MARLIGFRGLLCAAIAAVLALNGGESAADSLRLVTDTYPGPFRDDDRAPGPDIEILRQVFAAMGQNVSFESFPRNRDWMMVERGERDGMSGVLRTSERERICSFPEEPLREERSVLFVRTADVGKLKFSSFDDLVGHEVAVIEPIPDSSEHPLLSLELRKFQAEHHNMVGERHQRNAPDAGSRPRRLRGCEPQLDQASDRNSRPVWKDRAPVVPRRDRRRYLCLLHQGAFRRHSSKLSRARLGSSSRARRTRRPCANIFRNLSDDGSQGPWRD